MTQNHGTHSIDLSRSALLIPAGWTVEEHIGDGVWKWNPEEIALLLTGSQKCGQSTSGQMLREVLEGKPVFNANVLDYLLVHQELVPRGWKAKGVVFLGTIYRNARGVKVVRILTWRGGWRASHGTLSREYSHRNPVAIRSLPDRSQ